MALKLATRHSSDLECTGTHGECRRAAMYHVLRKSVAAAAAGRPVPQLEVQVGVSLLEATAAR